MASSVQPKMKGKKYQNGLSKELLIRLRLITNLDDYPLELTDTSLSLVDSYAPQLRGSCTLYWYLPRDPLNITEYRRCTVLPAHTPYFAPPAIPAYLPGGPRQRAHVCKPFYTSLLPLLLTARHARVDIRQYDIVCERNSIRKFVNNNEDYIISVARVGSIIFLRRHPSYRSVDRNDVGFRFEQMCTIQNGFVDGTYHRLAEGQIGELRVLILAETDAVKQENFRESIELKCQQKTVNKSQQHDWWLQAFLDYIISVARVGSTIFLRRHPSYRSVDRNDVGFRFEQMCTIQNGFVDGTYHRLVEGRIGELRVLILAETDAVKQENFRESIELKCQQKFVNKSKQHDWWLQAFLGGTNTIIHGRRLNADRSQITHIKEYDISELSDAQTKIQSFQRIHRVLQFLGANVFEERTYLLRQQTDDQIKKKKIYLYEAINDADIEILTFITRDILDQLAINH
ncbi:unnamed protein product [Adineta ricciae]|uniref:Decapping nuclease n=1 Tax=Adineta ricciae TaxID=249248 RepID=A0A815TIF7_ADIRI|nr:unnamed protein product [Adineta ricciae]